MATAHICVYTTNTKLFVFFFPSASQGTECDSFVFHTAAEVQAIASMIEKQAQIVVKTKEVTEESKKRKEALLAQYANITDEEEYPCGFSCCVRMYSCLVVIHMWC